MLRKISEEIREILDEKRKSLDLSFIEEDHIYFMRNLDGAAADERGTRRQGGARRQDGATR